MELHLFSPLFQFDFRMDLLFHTDLRLIFFMFVCYNFGHHLGHALFSSQSYWDWLRPDIQEHIISLANDQHISNMNKESGRDKLHEDIRIYHRLKEVWGFGHIKIKMEKCDMKYNSCPGRVLRLFNKPVSNRHTVILGYYVNRQNRMTHDFLRHTFEETF